jgi:DNA-binding Lrp family transcriptional regulator
MSSKNLRKFGNNFGLGKFHTDSLRWNKPLPGEQKMRYLLTCSKFNERTPHMSVQAYILIQTEVGKASSVARSVSAIAGVTLAEGVTGPYDVIMRAEAPSMEEFGRVILSKVQAVAGITRTLTCPVTSY